MTAGDANERTLLNGSEVLIVLNLLKVFSVSRSAENLGAKTDITSNFLLAHFF